MLVLDGAPGAGSLCFTADGARLLAVRYPNAVDLWTLATGARTELLPSVPRDIPLSLTLHPAGAVRVAGGQIVSVAVSGGPPRTATGAANARQVRVSPDASRAVIETYADGDFGYAGYPCDPDLRFGTEPTWEAPSSHFETLFGFVGADRFVALDGQRLVVRDAATGEVRARVKYPSYHLHSWAVSPDGGRFAVMGYDKLYIWDTATWELVSRVPGLNRWIGAMAFHPTRPILLAIQHLQTLVKFLDATTGKPIAKFQWKLGEMTSVCFGPDGALAAAGSRDGKIVVWDVD